MRALKLFILISITLIGCKTEEKLLVKENPPTVVTKAATDVSFQNATLNGEVADEGFSATSDRGFVYSDKNTNPTGNDSRVQVGFGKGVYFILLDKLPVNTKYYYKAYATNTKGISLGEVQSFTTADYKLPTAVTDVPKNITYTTAELGGSVIDEGGGAVSESGFVVGTNVSPTITDLKFPVTKGKVSIAIIVNKLNVNTKYYVRSYAINEKGIAYGNEQIFTTLDYKLPTSVTDAPLNISFYSVGISCSVTDDGGLKVSERGICYGLNSNPTVLDNKVKAGEGDGAFAINLQNLKDNSKYYVRAYAINSKGMSYSNEQTFKTLSIPPRDNKTIVVEVKSKTGRIWMDRNLGASQVATNPTDDKAYGDLYQWGRGADGHQIRTSTTTTILSNIFQSINGNFILTTSSPNDWCSPQNTTLWQGVNSLFNPCPNGYRLPTVTEWDAERLSWGKESPFDSKLKLPNSGRRITNGSMSLVGRLGFYWSSTVNNTNTSSQMLVFDNNSMIPIIDNSSARANGQAVRCIKD